MFSNIKIETISSFSNIKRYLNEKRKKCEERKKKFSEYNSDNLLNHL